jgi:hypothetical protein
LTRAGRQLDPENERQIMSADSTAVVRRAPGILSDDEIARSWRIAEAMARSGLFPDAKSAEAAFAKMLVGLDLGLSPTQALMGVHMVEGKPQISSAVLAGFVRQSSEYEYEVAEHDDEHCVIGFYRRDPELQLLGMSEFSLDDAERAGLVKDRGAWRKYPRNMTFARAMSNGVRWYCADLLGGVPVYTEADEFERREVLTMGSADEPREPMALGIKVEKVIARAVELGHVGLSDRATIEMSLKDRAPQVASEWAANAEAELDRFEAEQPPEAEVVGEPVRVIEALGARIEALREAGEDAEADVLNSQMQGLIAEGTLEVVGEKISDDGTAEQHRAMAKRLRAMIDATEDEEEKARLIDLAAGHDTNARALEAGADQ